MGVKHMLDKGVARKLGVNCAIILEGLFWWVDKNKNNNKHFYDGYYWTYNSTKAFSEQYDYFTERQIEYALKKLETEGYILVGNFNRKKFDKTKWYTLTKKAYDILFKYEEENTQNNNVERYDKNVTSFTNDVNSFNNDVESFNNDVESINNNVEPIPVIYNTVKYNTDKYNTNNNNIYVCASPDGETHDSICKKENKSLEEENESIKRRVSSDDINDSNVVSDTSKKIKKYSERFEEFWNLYPRKKEKQKAYKAYQARLREGWSERELIEATEKYVEEIKRNHTPVEYIKHGATFLSANTPFYDYLQDDTTVKEKEEEPEDFKSLMKQYFNSDN